MAQRSRLHKVVHRVAGSSMALVGAVAALQGVDFTPILGADAGAKVLTFAGLAIVALEFLPVLDDWLTDDPPVDVDH